MRISEIITCYISDRHALGRRYLKTKVGDFPLLVHPKDRHFWASTNSGEWEPETIEFMTRHIKSGTRYLDIGAFVGPTVILAKKLGATVTCFEPDHAALERLFFNVRMNTDGQGIDIFPFALGDRDGVISISSMSEYLGQACTTIHQGHPSSPAVKVLMKSWDAMMSYLGNPVFDVVKIDIEGGESSLLPAMLPYLSLHRPVLHLSTHLCFVPQERRMDFISTLREVWQIYGRSKEFDPSLFEQGTPNFFLEKR